MSVSAISNTEIVACGRWTSLPEEIWLEIFKYLPQSTILFVVRDVCRLFRALCMDVDLWRMVDMNILKETTNAVYPMMDTNFYHEQGDTIDQLAHKLLEQKHLTNTDIFCPLFGCIGTSVVELSFSRYIGDFMLGQSETLTLYQCTNLTHLDAGFCESITPVILKNICVNCTKLQLLVLDSCRKVDDEALTALNLLKHLTTLDISHCATVTDLGLYYVANMPSKLIHFFGDGVLHVTDSGISVLIHGQYNLETLVLDGEGLTDASVAIASRLLPNLQTFQISFCQNLTDQSFRALFGKARLKKLSMKKLESHITTQVITEFFAQDCLQNMTSLGISDCMAVSDETVKSIASCSPQLEHISLQWCCDVTDAAVETLVASCRHLKEIILVGLKSLRGIWLVALEINLPKLKLLDLTYCNLIPDEDVYDLVLRKPDLTAYTYFHEKVDYSVATVEGPPGNVSTQRQLTAPQKCAGSLGAEVDF